MSSYQAYAQRIARDAQIAEGNERRQAAALQARKAQARKDLQPEYTAISNWISEQMAANGMGPWMNESQKLIDALNERVNATK